MTAAAPSSHDKLPLQCSDNTSENGSTIMTNVITTHLAMFQALNGTGNAAAENMYVSLRFRKSAQTAVAYDGGSVVIK